MAPASGNPAFAHLLRTLAAPPDMVWQPVLDVRAPRGGRSAAVLILLSDTDEPDVTFLERAATLRKHAGQMAFPGGGADDTDADATATALREAQEEVGIAPSAVTVLGTLPAAHVAASGFDVVSVVATWSGNERIWAVDHGEVESVHRFKVSELADAGHRFSVRHRSGYTGPAFVFDDPAAPGEQIVIWGFTAHLVDRLLVFGGWEQPWDRDRFIDIPERFLRRPAD